MKHNLIYMASFMCSLQVVFQTEEMHVRDGDGGVGGQKRGTERKSKKETKCEHAYMCLGTAAVAQGGYKVCIISVR